MMLEPGENTPARYPVLGVGVSLIDLESAGNYVMAAAGTPGFEGYVTVTGVHGVIESQDDPALLDIHNRSFLTTPDGVPLVWLAKWGGHKEIARVYGPDLMEAIFSRCDESQNGYRHYLFGGGEGVADKLAGCLRERFPNAVIAGCHTPPFRPLTQLEEDALVSELREIKPHFVWVGLSTPKQERFMADFLRRYGDQLKMENHGLVLLGVGAAFDFHAGLIRQAPDWIQRIGCEWLFRLYMEPRRLWRRYLRNNPRFVWKLMMEYVSRGKPGCS